MHFRLDVLPKLHRCFAQHIELSSLGVLAACSGHQVEDPTEQMELLHLRVAKLGSESDSVLAEPKPKDQKAAVAVAATEKLEKSAATKLPRPATAGGNTASKGAVAATGAEGASKAPRPRSASVRSVPTSTTGMFGILNCCLKVVYLG